ncbi:alpha/beta hydrolase [uncultured Nitrosomonas sp.]|uniref:alpha/beta fold hydrolase n=1 Tax=uncultured Nitrosomonas sp. TaxID=156424 RepID=UPI0025EEE92B|nr:alpha/beta hydrolase [uncultured Nitrosomonas sp.]
MNSVSVSPEDYSFYSALSHPPSRVAGNTPDLSIYRPKGVPKYGAFHFKAPVEGLLQIGGAHNAETDWSDDFEIAWTKMGSKGPLVLFLHGVPTNRFQWEEVQGQVSRFCETISIDMLGMGESSKPRLYGRKDNSSPNAMWHWINDVDYIERLMQQEYPGRQFIFIADDWGSGIASHYAAIHNNRLNALVQMDPIAFDGYPVNEIQAIGRASEIPNTPEGDAQFAMLLAAFDQTLVQILKSMVYDSSKYNQYNLRSLTFPYVDVDYERNGKNDGVTDVARSTTMRLKLHNLRVLSDRAAILSPSLLLPHHPQCNPHGVQYQNITVPTLIMWGEFDNMMPAAQTQRFVHVLGTDDVQITYIPRAGHFPATDNPGCVTDTILNFIRRVMGRSALADIYIGNQGIWKGDERQMIQELRVLHGIAD